MAGGLFSFFLKQFIMRIRMTLSKIFRLIYNCTCIDLLTLTCPFDLWLREDIYSHDPPVLSRVTMKKSSTQPIPNESDVSCAGCELPNALVKHIIGHTPFAQTHMHILVFPKSLHTGPVRLSHINCISNHHAPPWHQFVYPSEGGCLLWNVFLLVT